jgi:heptosyltransferase-2
MKTMKIAVRAPNWIGDAVLSLPAVASIQRSFPQDEVWIAAEEGVKDLFSADGLAAGVVTVPRSKDVKTLRRAARELKGHGFKIVILLTNSFGSALLFYLAGVPDRWGYGTDGRALLLTRPVRVRERETPRHQLHYYLDLVSGLGLKILPAELRYPLPPEEKEKARAELLRLGIDPARPLVILSPGASYGPAKKWPTSRFARLSCLFQEEKKAEVLIVGSAHETETARTISSSLSKKPVSLMGRTTLPQLLGLLSLARLVISNDSGPMHLANSLRVPVVGIFGPTDPAVTGPFEQPSAVVKKDVPCWPCTYRNCPYDHRCMMSIEPEEVYRVAETLWR